MTITSADIQNHTFSIDRKGYDVDEVDVFLERLANEVDEMNAIIMELEGSDDKFSGFDTPASTVPSAELAEKDAIISDLQRELEEKKANDNAIAQALIIAQRSSDEIIATANQDAAQIRQDAEDEAQRILDKANNEKQRIIEEIEKLEDDREDSRAEYQDLLKDFISDASKKLTDLGASTPVISNSAHGRPATSSKNQAPIRKTVNAATYTTPQPSTTAATPVVAAATPRPSKIEKDLSGFGDADDAFEFDEID